ncbi:MAG: DUF3267 domain-containing protein [bacterium]|nr:DUF3267 domain-containing protein [bacterium]
MMNDPEQNFRIEDIRIKNMTLINIIVFIISMILFLLFTVLGVAILIHQRKPFRAEYNLIGLITLPLLNMIAHELIHAFTYIILSKGSFKDFEFGFNLKKMIAYCYLKKDVSIRSYRLIALMPLFILLPAGVIIFLIFPGPATSIFLVISLTGPVFDIYYTVKIRNFKLDSLIRETKEQDHLFVLIPETGISNEITG